MDVSKMQMGIYSVYLLGRSAGKFQKSLKVKCEKEKMVLTRSYAEQINSDWQNKGRYCEFHEEETIQYYENGVVDRANKKEAEETEKEVTKVLKEAIKDIKKPKARRKPLAKKANIKASGADNEINI
jgi:creatinine amidohydrolase/Fe(II)-dependent formamide hydrolase-like protein